MINTSNTVLDQGPKTFNGVGVNVAHNVEIMRVKNALVSIAVHVESIVNRILIGINACSLLNFLGNNREQGCSFGVGDNVSLNRSVFSPYNSDNRSLVFCSPSSFSFTLPAKVGLVNLNFPAHRVNVFRKHHADLFAHSPSGFISNASFPFNLFGRNTTTSLSHQIDSVKPSGE